MPDISFPLAAAVQPSQVAPAAPILDIRDLSVHAGSRLLLRQINLQIPPHSVFALIGPSGVGKSTLLKSINRLTDLTPGLRLTGDIHFHGQSVCDPRLDPDALRQRIGILFQQPVIFPKSILHNVLFGVRQLRLAPRLQWAQIAERALRESALWDEVKDRLAEPAARLSVGQQQRLCLARTLAVGPEVILMDEPTSALDCKSTAAIEQLILQLARTRTVVLVTHNLSQACRIAHRAALLNNINGAGQVIQCAPPSEILATHFQNPDSSLHLKP